MAHIYDRAYFQRPTIEREYHLKGKTRDDQLMVLQHVHGRRILSVGCGLGYLEHLLENIGLLVTGLDIADNREYHGFDFELGGLDDISPDANFDTIVFCEALEHIAEDEFERNWPKLVNILRRSHGRLIISNWEKFHPIYATGWDHIRQVDDALFDRLASEALGTVFRRGAQLVLQF